MLARTFAESGSNAIAILDLDQTLAEEAATDLENWFVEQGEHFQGVICVPKVSSGHAEPDEIDAIGIACDVSKEEAVKSAFDNVIKKFGRIDVLV
jgi:D-arabinitol 2-dehydrogenase